MKDVARSAAARDDRYFVDWISIIEKRGNDSMASLVICGDLLLFLRQYMTLSFRAEHDFFDCADEVVLRDFCAVLASGQNSAFVHKRIEICTRESRRALCYDAEIHIFSKRLLAGVDAENLFAVVSVGHINSDAAIESARAQKRWV